MESYLAGNIGSTNEFREIYWAGVPGCTVKEWTTAAPKIPPATFQYIPIFPDATEYDEYYNGFSNSLLWPLFHYFPSYAEYNEQQFDAYLQVNQKFAETLRPHLREGDTVWIHDYHLVPLAAMLRKIIPDLRIGFFLHIPFPSYEIFRLMPRRWQQELLKGLLGADLIGFHTIDYASHFLQTLKMIFSIDSERNTILYDNRLIKVDVFPISINFRKFYDAYDDDKITFLRNEIRRGVGNKKIIFSVDRLDYTKGVQNRLLAYEHFLKNNPQYLGRVVFIIVIVPSRDTISKYIERKKQIDELIGRINSSIGNLEWMPVIYNYHALDFENMVALYGACDLAVITPLRDGMNLVSKEFVASRKDRRGVLVLSEMAGSARELTHAFTINPYDIAEISNCIREGLEMTEENQAVCMENMQKRVSNYDVKAWAEEFIKELDNVKNRQKSFVIRFLDEYERGDLYDAYRQANNRLFLLDYDGTLVTFRSNPEDAVPGENLLKLLNALSSLEGNEVYLISGRSSSWLERQFGHLPIGLVAEHGARYKTRNEKWETEVSVYTEWKEKVHSIMDMYVRRCANTFKEEKEFSMVWHFRNANTEEAKLRAHELVGDLNDYIHNRHLQVMMGNKIVEVRHSGVNKGSFIRKLIQKKSRDFVFAAGDDRTDEDMFKALLDFPNTYSFKIGPDASYAKYNLYTPQMLVSLLESLSHLPIRNDQANPNLEDILKSLP
jgi:trehalose 6-phosphate synthase/phosphatase